MGLHCTRGSWALGLMTLFASCQHLSRAFPGPSLRPYECGKGGMRVLLPSRARQSAQPERLCDLCPLHLHRSWDRSVL